MTSIEFTPSARWTQDVGGKQDFDGRFLSISTRYWPAWKSSDNRPSAHAAIIVHHGGLADDEDEGDYSTLSDHEFSADTEAEVKVQVEEWVRAECGRILTYLLVLALPGGGKPTNMLGADL